MASRKAIRFRGSRLSKTSPTNQTGEWHPDSFSPDSFSLARSLNLYLISAALFAGGLFASFLCFRYFRLVLNGEKTQGQVIDVLVKGAGTAATSRAVVAYEVEQQAFQIETKVGSSDALPRYHVGQVIGVHYPPGRPERGVIVSIVEFLKWGFLIVFSLAALFASIIVLVMAIRRGGEPQPPAAESRTEYHVGQIV